MLQAIKQLNPKPNILTLAGFVSTRETFYRTPCYGSTKTLKLSSLHLSTRSLTPTRGLSEQGCSTMNDRIEIERVACLSDNYSWILQSKNVTAVVDPSEAEPVIRALGDRQLTHIINTHHHWDHVGGNEALKSKYNCTIIGPRADKDRIPGIDVALGEGDVYALDDTSIQLQCYDTPGHTRGHVTYYVPQASALFPGDTLFSLGCGRLFEGTPSQMWSSLSKLKALPPETKVYCAHEYTLSNAKFALAVDVENEELKAFASSVETRRKNGEATIPSILGDELKCNPFLRPDSPSIRKQLGIPLGSDDVNAFAKIRSAKDAF